MSYTAEIETSAIPANFTTPDGEMAVHYTYVPVAASGIIFVLTFMAEHEQGGTTVEAVRAAIESQHPGKTVILSDFANEWN